MIDELEYYECRGVYVPGHLLEVLKTYVTHRIPAGGYLTAVLENNLMEAIGRADEHSYQALRATVSLVHNEMPHTCWGSPDKVKAWLERKEG